MVGKNLLRMTPDAQGMPEKMLIMSKAPNLLPKEIQMRVLTLASSVAITTALLAGCSTPPKVAEKPAEAPAKPVVQDNRAVATVTAPVVDPLDDPKNILSKRSVYFDFDAYVVKPEYANIVSAHSTYIRDGKSRKVLIQGNTDERGGSEYNLALGQKRAEALRKAMVILGTPDAQIEAVSYGKEKPKATGHDEASWAENRRDDIVYTSR